MHHTSDTLYFKENNLVIKHVLPLKLECTGFVDANTYKHTSRNIGATMRASRIFANDKVF